MTALQKFYVPALRMKAGEQMALSHLASDVADHVLPRMIVPPRAERDQTLELDLMDGRSAVPNVAGALSACWLGRSVFVEATHLLADFGRETMGLWLPKMFERTWRAGVPAVPLVQLRDLTADTRDIYSQACRESGTRLGIVASADELDERDALKILLEHLGAMGLSTANCSVIADFSGSDFSQPEIVAPIIAGTLQMLQEIGQWQHVIFQGTNYPQFNPAAMNSNHIVLRNEWQAWRQAVKFDPLTSEYMMFGDYAADSAKMEFESAVVRAIRHYRYASSDAWIVQRGAASGSDDAVMRTVCRELIDTPQFAGRDFSWADDYIFLSAHGQAGPGNPRIWRAINTVHHITRVVADIGLVRGFQPQQRAAVPLLISNDLFSR